MHVLHDLILLANYEGWVHHLRNEPVGTSRDESLSHLAERDKQGRFTQLDNFFEARLASLGLVCFWLSDTSFKDRLASNDVGDPICEVSPSTLDLTNQRIKFCS